jgi:hypothetical protein
MIDGSHSRRYANLSAAFEADGFFIRSHVDGLSSFLEACKALLAAGMRLAIKGEEVLFHAGVCPIRRLSESHDDDFGVWPDGADRTLGGLFDGIMLHQVLQWHDSRSPMSGEAMPGIRARILAGGLFLRVSLSRGRNAPACLSAP